MISYSNMNMSELESFVYQYLKKIDSGTNISWGTFVKVANRVFKYVASKTLPYKGWAYQMYSQPLLNGDSLPYDYIDKVRCVVQDESGIWREARFSHPREYYITTNSDNYNVWTNSTIMSPIYTIFGDLDVNLEQRLKIYFEPNTYSAMLTYYAEPPTVDDKLDLVPLPNEYENLAILEIIARLMLANGLTDNLSQIYQKINEEQYAIVQRLADVVVSEKKAMEAYTPESFFTIDSTGWKVNGWQNLYRGN